jgi:hypothetical protein
VHSGDELSGPAARFSPMRREAHDLDREMDRFASHLPDWLAKTVRWLRKPGSILVRVPVAVILVAGGFLSFLPVLGIWMLPLGLVLIAQDVPFLRPPMARMLAWINRKWPARESAAKQERA